MLDDVSAIIDAHDSTKGTRLYCAASQGQHEMMKLLIKIGSNPNVPSFYGAPLHVAAANGDVTATRLLIESGATVDIRSDVWLSTSTPLQEAVYYNQIMTVELLLQHGADPNVLDVGGVTPLFQAVFQNNIEMVKLLIRFNARVDIVNKYDQSLLWYSYVNGVERAILEILIHALVKKQFSGEELIYKRSYSESREKNIEINQIWIEMESLPKLKPATPTVTYGWDAQKSKSAQRKKRNINYDHKDETISSTIRNPFFPFPM
jgi:ankyrin repeat protein